jgi:hypothetical protein
MAGYENFLLLEVVWKDDWAIQLEYTLSNNGFSGRTRFYDSAKQLALLAKQLEGFPIGNQSIHYKIGEPVGEPAGESHLSFCSSLILPSGLVRVRVHLENEELHYSRVSKVSTELFVELGSLDTFQKFLSTLAATQQGMAKLVAR